MPFPHLGGPENAGHHLLWWCVFFPLSSSCCTQLEHLWIDLRSMELWVWIFQIPEAQCILTLSTFLFSEPNAIPCNVDATCHFPNTGKPWRAARRWACNNVRPQWSDRLHAVFLFLSLALYSLFLFLSLPVLLQQALSLPRIDMSLLCHNYTKSEACLLACKQADTKLQACTHVHVKIKNRTHTHTNLHNAHIHTPSIILSLNFGRSEWCRAWRRSSLMETNVDTLHPRTCSQLTHCLIKVIYWFIYERLKVAVKRVHAALTLQSGLILYFYLDFNGNNLLKHPSHYQTDCVSIFHWWRREIDSWFWISISC